MLTSKAIRSSLGFFAILVSGVSFATPGDGLGPPNGASGDGSTGIQTLDSTEVDNGFHVRLFSGEFQLANEDLRIPGRGFDFVWQRVYRSRVTLMSEGPLGPGWDFSYNIRLFESDGARILCTGNGRCDTYTSTGSRWHAAGFFNEIAHDGGTGEYTITFPDQTTWILADTDDSPLSGRILQIEDRNRNRMRFEYDGVGRLSSIRDTLTVDVPEPPIAASGYPHGALKNRYISFVPNPGNAEVPVAYRISVVDGSNAPVAIGWVGVPDASGRADVRPLGSPAHLTSWPAVVHVYGCEIAPVNSYQIRTIALDGRFSTELLVSTIPQPAPRYWGDIVGAFAASGNPATSPPTPPNSWEPPNGATSGVDISAALQAASGYPTAPYFTWCDVNPEILDGVVTGPDTLQIVNAFSLGSGREFYPFPQPLDCPNATGGSCGSDCDDQDPCTLDGCSGGVCEHLLVADCTPRTVSLVYDGNGRIESVTDWTGRSIVYDYYGLGEAGGSEGDLKSVTYPVVTNTTEFPIPGPAQGYPDGHYDLSGRTWTYTYAKNQPHASLDHNLLTITDPLGQTFLVNTYAPASNPADPFFDRLTAQTLNSSVTAGGMYNYHYGAVQQGNAVWRTIVNDRMGNVEELYFDDQNRLRARREFTGRAPDPQSATTPTANRPTAPLRITDPTYFETQFEFNVDSMPTLVVFPNGNSIEQQFDTGYTAFSGGNLLSRQRNRGPVVADQDSICELWVYDYDFNVPVEYIDPTGETTFYTIDSPEPQTTGTRLTSCGQAIAGKTSDDTSGEKVLLEGYTGNLEAVECVNLIEAAGPGDPITCFTFSYNDYGQLTAKTQCTGRTDRFTYHSYGPQYGYLASKTVDYGGQNLTESFVYDSVGNLRQSTDPKGNTTDYVYNQLNELLLEQMPAVDLPGGPVRYEREAFWDPTGNVYRIETDNYDDLGNLDNNATWTTWYVYDWLDNLTQHVQEVDQARDIVVEYEYDANENPTLTRFGEATNSHQPANVQKTEYDERDMVFKKTRGFGGADASTSQFDYDDNGNLAFLREGLEQTPRIHAFTFDGFDRAFTYTDPMGTVGARSYDSFDNLIQNKIQGEGVAGEPATFRTLLLETFSYDKWQRPKLHGQTIYQMVGGSWTTVGYSEASIEKYTNASQIEELQTPLGDLYTVTYDSANRLRTITDSAANTLVYSYDFNSNPLTAAEIDKSETILLNGGLGSAYEYDALDRVTRVRKSNGEEWFYHYDSRGNVLREIDANGTESRHVYDGLNRRVQTTLDMDSDGADGDGLDIVTTMLWDDSSRLIAQTDDNGRTTRYASDALDRNIGTRYADGTWSQVGSGLDWSVDAERPTLTSFTSGYDVHDNVLRAEDPNGSAVASTFDLANRVIQRSIVPGPTVASTTTYETFKYDGLSRVVYAENDDTVVVREFSSLGVPTSETIRVGEAVCGNGILEYGEECEPPGAEDCDANCTLNFGHDCCEEHPTPGCSDPVIEAEVCGQFPECCTEEWTYAYLCPSTPDCTLTAPTNHTKTVTTFAYDVAGNEVGTEYPGNGTVDYTGQDLLSVSSVRDALGRLKTLGAANFDLVNFDYVGRLKEKATFVGTVTGLMDPVVIVDYIYGARRLLRISAHPIGFTQSFDWDDVGNRRTRENHITDITHTLGYDAARRLVRVNAAEISTIRDTTYEYDGVHNRVSVTGNPDSGVYVGSYVMDATSPVPADAQVNQYTSTPFDLRQYDDNSNLVLRTAPGGSPALAELKYDYRNRMVEYRDLVSGQIHKYVYDALGRRVSKTVDSTGVNNGPNETRYFYGGPGLQRVVEERDGATGEVITAFVYGDGIDEPWVMFADPDDDNRYEEFYFLADDASNVYQIRDLVGVPVEQYEYGDFGQPVDPVTLLPVAGSPSSIGNPYLFTGRRYDAETGLYWYRTRYFDPVAGRFTSWDTIGAWGDRLALGSAFAYAANNPWTWVDPWGWKIVIGENNTPAFNKAVGEAIDTIKNLDPQLKQMVEVLESSEHTYTITSIDRKNRTNRYDNKDDTIYWDHDNHADPSQPGTREPCVGLCHEFSHAYDNETDAPRSEDPAVRRENRARERLRERDARRRRHEEEQAKREHRSPRHPRIDDNKVRTTYGKGKNKRNICDPTGDLNIPMQIPEKKEEGNNDKGS
ncbi:MAG: RHS repeat-associated core domain-containing protein [Phycisphaerae bacterium]|nr:RHS repeat-associated core domain-containing protein [Phycisphaerae bacterium]